jgi:hypothetical protein
VKTGDKLWVRAEVSRTLPFKNRVMVRVFDQKRCRWIEAEVAEKQDTKRRRPTKKKEDK